jgi:glycosyltransferase involved in cell wall biosynthesis
MRVTYLVNQYPKASHSFIRREIAGLEACGFEVDRWSIRRVDEPLVDPADRAEAERTRVVLDAGAFGLAKALLVCALRHPLRTVRALREALRLARAAGGQRLKHMAYLAEACVMLPQVRRAGSAHVHAHFGTNSAAVALLLESLGGPSFSFTAHGTESFEAPEKIGLAQKLARARFAVAVCEYGKRELARHASPDVARRLLVVRCGVDEGFLAEPQSAPPGVARFVCVARLSPEKGHALLLEAAARVAARGLDFEMRWVGDGELREELERRARELGLAERIHFLGWKSGAEVRAEILGARALVLPSLAEGLPVVLMEALALARPVVATDVGGVSELVESEVDGWLVPARDIEALAAGLEAALRASREDLARMGQAGAARVAERHDARIEARRLGERFRALAAARP